MSADSQRTKCRRNIAENFNLLKLVQPTLLVGRQHSEREREFTFAKIVWLGYYYWSLKMIEE